MSVKLRDLAGLLVLTFNIFLRVKPPYFPTFLKKKSIILNLLYAVVYLSRTTKCCSIIFGLTVLEISCLQSLIKFYQGSCIYEQL